MIEGSENMSFAKESNRDKHTTDELTSYEYDWPSTSSYSPLYMRSGISVAVHQRTILLETQRAAG